MLLALAPAAADVYQVGIDAARTGVAEDAGPKLDEVAWTTRLPGSTTMGEWPMIIGEYAYIPTSDIGHPGGLDQNAIWEVSLVDGQARKIIELDATEDASGIGLDDIGTGTIRFPHSVVTDGDRFYVAGPERVVAYDIATGNDVWEWRYPELYLERDMVWCASNGVAAGMLYLGCTTAGRVPSNELDQRTQTVQIANFVAALALDRQDADRDWLWIRDGAMEGFEELTPENPTCTIQDARGGTCALLSRVPIIVGLSAFGGTVAASFYSITDPPNGAAYKGIVGLSQDSGELLWVKQSPRDLADPQREPRPEDQEVVHFSFYPVGDDADGFLAFRELMKVDPRTGDPVGEVFDMGARSHAVPEVGSAFALTEDRVFFTSTRFLFAADRDRFPEIAWHEPLPADWPDAAWSQFPLTYADGVVYGRVADGFPEEDEVSANIVMSTVADDTSHFLAYDAANQGALLWSRTIQSELAPRYLTLHSQTVAAGLMIVAGQDGNVIAIGRTPASLQPVVEASNLYPAVNATVTLDASATPPSTWAGTSASTAPSLFRVDWGDGTETDWLPEPVFSHAYEEGLDRQAILYVQNEAGQQSAEAIRFHVGDSPPREPNPLGQWVRQNPDAFWGIIGLFIVLVGAGFTSYRLARRRGIMAREMAAIDAAAGEAGSSSTRLQAAMDERSARAHGLLLDHRIDEAQYQILRKHIEEAGRTRRKHRLRELFGFLPFDMVRALEEMLEDGQISTIERRGIQTMLDEDKVLTKAQKRRVGALVDEWFGQDARASR